MKQLHRLKSQTGRISTTNTTGIHWFTDFCGVWHHWSVNSKLEGHRMATGRLFT